MSSITLKVGSKTAPLGAETAKESGNTYYCIGGPAAARFGVKVPALAKALPTEVELAGVKVPLTHKNRDSDGKRQAAAHGVTVQIDGTPKTGKVVLTDHGDGTWQVTAAIFGKGGATRGVNTNLFA